MLTCMSLLPAERNSTADLASPKDLNEHGPEVYSVTINKDLKLLQGTSGSHYCVQSGTGDFIFVRCRLARHFLISEEVVGSIAAQAAR